MPSSGDVLLRWRDRSVASGWAFPRDWILCEAEDVVDALLSGADLTGPLGRLGRARARAGCDLRESLQDVTALYSLVGEVQVEQDLPIGWLRAVATGWADEAVRGLGRTRVDDGLTGLVTRAYLRTRLAEVYQEDQARGTSTPDRYALVAVSVDLTELPRLSRLSALVLVANALQLVFHAGETKALVAPATAAVLVRTSALPEGRIKDARQLIAQRLAADGLSAARVRAWSQRLPARYESACDLVNSLRG
ncbi:hypothetical protein GCM10010174_17870 [Kutzneria viridogrisea]|uniref:GGDEF domain-containing protein n=2 Tax=Kutzneria TaxID=43356 RepID=W5WEM8_9PSEU|nr:hypothetical protein [Kutzneria albida]AHH99638.1 hypothetical protein KALB_6278 [Kutzneria albida DSM 43870]MBA8922806.1 hypothetical protein [Kutzneria viridogrisea]